MMWRGSDSSSKASAASTPVQCTGSPLVACSSNSATSKPVAGQQPGGFEAARAAADDEYVAH